MDLLTAVTQQLLGPAPHEEVQLFSSRPVSKNPSRLDLTAEGQESEEDNPFHQKMRNMVLDIYSERPQETLTSERTVQSDCEPDRDKRTRKTTRLISNSSSSSLPSRPRSATGLSLTTVTFPQTENLPSNSYDVALNASVEMTSVKSSSPPVTPTSMLSESHSSLPESLRELTSETHSVISISEEMTSGYHRRLQFDETDNLLGAKQTESSQLTRVNQSESDSSSTFDVSNQVQNSGNKDSPPRVNRNNLVPFTPPFSSPLSLQTDSVKRKAREAALQLHALREEKAHLQGKLKSVHAEYSHVLEEKVTLQSALAACQAELEIAKQRNESLVVKQTELQLAFNLMGGESKATQLRHQQVAGISRSRLSEVGKQVGTLQEQNEKLRLQCEQYTAALVSNQQAMDELERKIEESDRLVAVYQSDSAGLSNKLIFHQKKVDSLETTREFLEQQIEELRLQHKAVQEQGNRVKSELVSCREQLNQSQSDQLELELRLAGLQEARVTEKRHMVDMLEQISRDWADHEKAFEKARMEKRGVDEALRNAQRTAMEEKQRLEQMAEELGLQLEGTTKYLEVQVKAMQRIQSETSEMRKQLDSKDREWQEAEQRYQESLVTTSKLEIKLEHVEKEADEMSLKIEGLERDRMTVQQQMDLEAVSHCNALARAQHKHQEMEELVKSRNDALRCNTEELAKTRQREMSLAKELKLANERESEERMERDKIRKKLVDWEESHVRELAAKQEEVKGLFSKLGVAKQNISQLEEKVEMMKNSVTVREGESQRLTRNNQRLEEQVRVLTDELERQQLLYQECWKTQEALKQSTETEIKCVKDQHRVDVEKYIDTETMLKKQLTEAQQVRDRFEGETQRQLEELSTHLERVSIQASREKDSSSRQMTALRKQVAECESTLTQERKAFQLRLKTLEINSCHLREQLQESEAKSHLAVQKQKQIVEDLQHELSCLQLENNSKEIESEQKIETLTLALEIEKGKLSGILDTQSALKQHTSVLEAALAKRDHSLVRLSAQAKSALAEHEAEDREVTGRISHLESQLEERSQQLARTEAEQSLFRLHIEQLESKVATTTEQLSAMREKMETFETEKGKLVKKLDTMMSNLEMTQRQLDDRDHEVTQLAAELESVKSELLVKHHEQRSTIDRVESLTWELEQKTVECEQRERSMHSTTERHKQQINELQKQLETVRLSNQEMTIKLRETWAGKHTLEEEIIRSHDKMASFQLESESTAISEMELRTEADIQWHEARAVQERMENLEMQNDSLRRTASSLLDQCLEARRTPSMKLIAMHDPDPQMISADIDSEDSIMAGPARLVQ